ncbi:hypothetical protein GGH96_004253 [Coemansia sp. RSA 1972]|nr:hypothetical protein GGH96_004253 [Coemansia sp. RSA 1972]
MNNGVMKVTETKVMSNGIKIATETEAANNGVTIATETGTTRTVDSVEITTDAHHAVRAAIEVANDRADLEGQVLGSPLNHNHQTAGQDEKDRLEEEKIIAKIQNRLHNNGSGLRSDSDSGSDTSDEASGSQRSDNGSRRRSTRRKHSSRSKRRSKSKSLHTSKKHKSSRRKHRRRSESPSQSDASSHEDHLARSPVNLKSDETSDERQSQDENSDSGIGPMPAQDYKPTISEHGLGSVQRSGDGLLSSGFIQSSDRIPRRGEIGMDLNKIEQWENAGYVMSGNRRSRVNDTQVHREGQVITADEKRQMLLQNQEERQKKETQIISEFRDMLSKKRS